MRFNGHLQRLKRASYALQSLKPKDGLDYPCRWPHKVIGRDFDEIRAAVVALVNDRACSMEPSNQSKTGKYHSLNVEVEVQDEADRNAIYMALKSHPAVIRDGHRQIGSW